MKNIAKSLATFRTKIESVKKDADNPFFKSKYADLSSILDAIKAPLQECWLALSHRAWHTESGGYSLVSTIIDVASGEFIASEFPIFGSKPQEVGSSITYARRYNTLALLDIPTDEDDDGNKANSAPRTKSEAVGWQVVKWFNFKDLKKCIEWGTDTEALLTQYILDNEYKLSWDMKTCLRTYCDKWELIEPDYRK